MKKGNEILRDDTEPTMRQGAVFLPMWIVGLLGTLVYVAFNYVNVHGGNYNQLVYEPFRSTNELSSILPKDETAIVYNRGKIVFEMICAACHQASGAGNPGQAPPLAGSEWVLAPGPNRLIRIPMAGVKGTIKVKGVDWAGLEMSPFAGPGQMSDEDLAAVLTYIRNSWGNKAPAVTPEQVKNVRDDVLKNHPDQKYTVDELLAQPEQIP